MPVKTTTELRRELQDTLTDLELQATRVRAAISALDGVAPIKAAPMPTVAPVLPPGPPLLPPGTTWPPPGVHLAPICCTCGTAWGLVGAPPPCPVHGYIGGLIVTTIDQVHLPCGASVEGFGVACNGPIPSVLWALDAMPPIVHHVEMPPLSNDRVVYWQAGT